MEIYLVLGVVLYVSIVLDIIQTTLSMRGGGWLTSRFSHLFWKFFLVLSGRNGRSKILTHAGYILLISIVMIWVFLMWTSLVLILFSQPGAIIDSTTMVPANLWQIIYYSGYAISTLGMGDYIASGDVWRVLSSIYSFTGLILLTMSVTYFIPVLSAVIEQRKLGINLSTLGDTPQEIVLNAWNGKDFQRFTDKIEGVANSIIKYSQQHRAYPVIHYFHNNKQKSSVVLQLARLYEALTILAEKIKEDDRPLEQELKPLIIAFENYFETISEVTHITLMDNEPPAIDVRELIEKRLIGKGENRQLSNNIKKDRKFFKSLLYQDGWEWKDVDTKNS
ncbi:MAG: potassium channel family protein [Christiangramia sp.]